jgi:hypothetical protein
MTAPAQKTAHAAVVEPRAATVVTPTPTQHENDQFRIAQANGTLPAPTWSLKADGSPVSLGAFDPVQKSPTWP